MKQILTKMFFLLACFAATGEAIAQQLPPIPTDPDVKIGKLENGLTYYLRHNELPKGQADFYIAQKVGSILEEDNQRGLAHFLEHMCFNGTTHFPGNSLREYLESIGVKFGANLNAYTSIDETVYIISSVPVARESVIDSCLLILHDWADDLTLDPKEIDKERGVIHEEWRTRQSAMMRMYETAFPILFKDSKYAHRLPIGTMEVVDNFPYQALRDYYKKWYRPDLQGIIVVGDIDVEQVEAKIKSLFGSIRLPEHPAERTWFPVPDNDAPLVAVAKDKEMTTTQIIIAHKHEPYPDAEKQHIGYMAYNFMVSLIESMFNTRLDELTQTATPPFIGAGSGDGDFILSKTKAAFMSYAACKEDGIDTAIGTLHRELLRAARFGFTPGEYARAKADYLSNLEKAYNEREKVKNRQYVDLYVRDFIENNPTPSLEQEFGIMSQLAPAIPLEQVNALFRQWVTEKNIAIGIFCPEKEGMAYPTEEHILQLLKAVADEPIEAYVDHVSDEPLLAQLPPKGQVIKTEAGIFGSTVLTLSNGVRVVVKPTDFKADEIRLQSFSNGGTSVFDDQDALQFKYIDQIAGLGGLGNFSAIDLQKVLAGKIASATASVRGLTEAVNGSCSPKDLETLLQLVYLSFTAPRMDNDAFASFQQRMKAQLANLEANPDIAFSDSINVALYGNNPRARRLTLDEVDQIDYQRVIDLYKNRFEDASDFTFFFVGNMDLTTATPLIEQYLGALPSTGRKENFRDRMQLRKGQYSNVFHRDMATAKASELLVKNHQMDYTLRNDLLLDITAQLLTMEYTETVREEAGGTYGVSVQGSFNCYPQPQGILQIYFDTNPERRTEMVGLIEKGIHDFIEKGPKSENLQRVKEYLLKKYEENQKENGYWGNCLYEYFWTGLDADTDYVKTLNALTGADLQAFARSYFQESDSIEVSMTSGETK